MPTALEQLGLTPEDVGLQPQTTPQPSQALGQLGLTPSDIGQPQQPQPQPQEELGLTESFVQGVADSVSLGFTDELYGMAAGLIPGGQNREEATEAARARFARANPAAALAGQLVGGFALPGGAAATGARLGTRALRGAAAGLVTGGAGAVGRAEGSLEERAPAAVPGAALGAVLGGAGSAAAPAISQGVQRLLPTRREQTAVQDLVETIARGDDIGARAQDAVKGIQQAALNKKQGVNAAYDQVAKLKGSVEDKASFELLSNKLNRVLDEGGVEFVEGGDRIAGLADRVVSQLEGGATPEKMEKARQLISKVARGANPANKQEGLYLNQIKNAYDDWMFDTLTNKLYRGDEDALKTIKNARGLAAEYNNLFNRYTGGSGTAERSAGGMISRMLQDDVEAEEAVNLIFGAHALGVKGSRQALARIRDASPEAFEQLQSAHFMKLVTGPGGGDFLPADQIAKKIQRLNASGPLAKTLYGDRLPEINRFAQKLQASPNVAETIGRFIAQRPSLLGFVMGTAGGATLGGDVASATFGGILGAALSKGKGSPASIGRVRGAARPDALTTRRAGQVGGTVAGIVGPSLAGG